MDYKNDVDGEQKLLSSRKKPVALECDTFRDDVRAEWIRAVFGTEFPQRRPTESVATTNSDPKGGVPHKKNSWKGVGLAGISSYLAYTADLKLPQTMAQSSSSGISPNIHSNNDRSSKQGISSKNEEKKKESDEKLNNKMASESLMLQSDSQQLSLGMTLSRLSLGLYVRKVRPGSEAWCAGVEENSVLVGINDCELNLLAEPSKLALERIWQYEGYSCDGTEIVGAKAKASKESDGDYKRAPNAKMKIRDPISMTFIRAGQLYKVIFLSNGPYGIDWGPCGKFCLIQRVKPGGIADCAGVRPSSIVSMICSKGSDKSDKTEGKDTNQNINNKNTIYHLDHSSVAAILKEATPSTQKNHHHESIQLQLCFPPSEARSGHWERQQDDLEKRSSGGESDINSNATSSNKKATILAQDQLPRPQATAELDGAQIRIHPLLGGRGSFIGAGRHADRTSRRSRSPNNNRNSGYSRSRSGFHLPSSSLLSKMAERVSAGEITSISDNSDRGYHQESYNRNSFSSSGLEYGRFYRPCPVLSNVSVSTSSQIKTNIQNPSSNKQSSALSKTKSPSILECWNIQQTLIYIFQHHMEGYNEVETRIRASKDTDFLTYLQQWQSHTNGNISVNRAIRTISSALSTFLLFWFGWLSTQDKNTQVKFTEYLCKLINMNQIICDIEKSRLEDDKGDISFEAPSYSLAYHMEFLSGAFASNGIKKILQKIRKERRQMQHVFENQSQSNVGGDKLTVSMPPTIRAVTGLTPNHRESPLAQEPKSDEAPIEEAPSAHSTSETIDSSKPRFRRAFRFFRKRKQRRKKKQFSTKSNSANTTIDRKQQTYIQKKTTARLDDKIKSSSSMPNNAKDSAMNSRPGTSASRDTKSSSLILKELSMTTPSNSMDSLFENTLWFLGELELVCSDIEKSLMRSFSQKFARWALQPWTSNKESALANVTKTMRKRLNRCNLKSSCMPLLDPIDSSFQPLSSIDSDECYILPSAHFPLLLTFECERGKKDSYSHCTSRGHYSPSRNHQKVKSSTASILFGEERIYSTTVELIALKGSRVVENDEKLHSRGFTIHGSVSGSVNESAQSVGIDQESNNHIWNNANRMIFKNRSTWGPPQTLSLRLSEARIEQGEDGIESTAKVEQKECGYCWISLSPYWEKLINKEPQNCVKLTTKAKVVPYDVFKDFDEHGDLPERSSPENMEQIEVELQVTTEILKPKSSVKRSLLYKHDDDVRQEMFAIEFMKSCDRILRSCGLDMKMLIYRCISVGNGRGFMEWVQGSVPLSEICQPFAGSILAKSSHQKKKSKAVRRENNIEEDVDEGDAADDDDNITLSSVAKAGMTKYESLSRIRTDGKSSSKQSSKGSAYVTQNNENPIQDFLRSLAYDPDDPYKIRRDVMDNFVKSCAGYSVCTYILGVGDRHLDNLLLHESGHFFHCDYSFILGKDPKKYLPMRITQDMINGMGGWKSDNFCQFLSLASAAFLTLRRPENVRHLLSLIRLLEGCNFHDLEKTQTIESAIQGVRERLKLDCSDEEAIIFMEKLIQDSCSSKMWIAVDAIHNLAQKF